MATCVLKSLTAPQSIWNTTAFNVFLGDGTWSKIVVAHMPENRWSKAARQPPIVMTAMPALQRKIFFQVAIFNNCYSVLDALYTADRFAHGEDGLNKGGILPWVVHNRDRGLCYCPAKRGWAASACFCSPDKLCHGQPPKKTFFPARYYNPGFSLREFSHEVAASGDWRPV